MLLWTQCYIWVSLLMGLCHAYQSASRLLQSAEKIVVNDGGVNSGEEMAIWDRAMHMFETNDSSDAVDASAGDANASADANATSEQEEEEVVCPARQPSLKPPKRDSVAPVACRESQKGKYVLFDKDPGQLGDIERGLVYVAAVACSTGRTLVLPPAHAWWGFDWGPNSHLGKLDQADGNLRLPNSTTTLETFYNIFGTEDDKLASLVSAVEVMTFRDFVALESERLQLPWEKLEGSEEALVLRKTTCKTMRTQYPDMPLYEGEGDVRIKYWMKYLKVHCSIGDKVNVRDLQEYGMRNFQTVGDLACPLTQRGTLETLVDSEQPVLYFPNDQLLFTESYNFKRMADCPIPTAAGATAETVGRYLFVKSHVSFRSGIHAMAESVRDFLGGDGKYMSFHFARVQTEGDKIRTFMSDYWQQFRDCGRIRAPVQVYVSINDANKSMFGAGWPNVHNVVGIFWEDVLPIIGNQLNQYKYKSPLAIGKVARAVEQLVAVPSAVFIGTQQYAFSDSVIAARQAADHGPSLDRLQHPKCSFQPTTCQKISDTTAFTRVGTSNPDIAIDAEVPYTITVQSEKDQKWLEEAIALEKLEAEAQDELGKVLKAQDAILNDDAASQASAIEKLTQAIGQATTTQANDQEATVEQQQEEDAGPIEDQIESGSDSKQNLLRKLGMHHSKEEGMHHSKHRRRKHKSHVSEEADRQTDPNEPQHGGLAGLFTGFVGSLQGEAGMAVNKIKAGIGTISKKAER